MSDHLAKQRAQNAKKQRDWRARHPDHREAHTAYMRLWRKNRRTKQKAINLLDESSDV